MDLANLSDHQLIAKWDKEMMRLPDTDRQKPGDDAALLRVEDALVCRGWRWTMNGWRFGIRECPTTDPPPKGESTGETMNEDLTGLTWAARDAILQARAIWLACRAAHHAQVAACHRAEYLACLRQAAAIGDEAWCVYEDGTRPPDGLPDDWSDIAHLDETDAVAMLTGREPTGGPPRPPCEEYLTTA